MKFFLMLCSAAAVVLAFGACDARPRDALSAAQRENTKPFMNTTQDLTGLPDAELKKTLSPEQYSVCRMNGTEPPFRNAFWDNHRPGIYVDVISGEPLFASVHKFDSGTGWPSFFETLEKGAVVEKTDSTHGMARTEVRSAKSDAHLGHLFDDGPRPTGMRYCINSASLRFIPKEELEAQGLAQYVPLFAKDAAR